MVGRAILVSVVLVLCSRSTEAEAQARAGLHAGVASSSLVLDSRDTGFRKGFVGGGWIRFPLVGAVGLQLGAYYAQKGSSDSIQEGTLGVELDYLSLPVGFAFLINRMGQTSGYLLTGGTLAIQRGCRISAATQGATASVDCESTGGLGGPAFSGETLDFGLVLGGGMEFDRGPIILTLDLRADFGFAEAINIYTQLNADEFDDDSGQNLSLAAMVGVAFPLGPRPTR